MAQTLLEPDKIRGTWVLDSFVIEYSDDRAPLHPLGVGATGQLIYAADGGMAAFLTAQDRSGREARLENAVRLSADEKVAAFDTLVSYGGRYTVEGDTIVHHVEHSLFPGLVGKDNRRLAHLDRDRLELSYTLTPPSGVQRHYRLRWRRP